jgi:prephenate dehydratase
MRISYLGPAGTFTEDALRDALGGADAELLPEPTVHDAIEAVAEGRADRALVPFENSLEGAVRSTLDTLAFEIPSMTIVGEHDQRISQALIAGRELPLTEITAVLSHPQASAQCARYIREQLPNAEVRGVASTAEAVREVVESDRPWAALGARGAAGIYGGVVLADGVEDSEDNVTRFVWIARPDVRPTGEGPWRTTLIFAELGEDRPGALVDALVVFSSRGVNLTRIESRPRRRGLGQYMFFVDLEGSTDDPTVTEAIEALREVAESVRILGSYPVGAG